MTVSRAPAERESRAEVRARLAGARIRAWLARLVRRGAAAPVGETFDAFISYSHRRDAPLAAALKRGLHRFGRPWYRVRALHVFLDNTNLAANPDLWSSIAEALARARHLVLLASPEAAASPWVEKELREWRASRPADRLVLVLTAGELRWDPAAQDFDWAASDAVPPALSGAFDAEPRWIDLRFAPALESPSLRDPRFRSAVADLAAPLHGRTKEELVGDDVREHRRTMRLVRATVVLLLALTAAAGFAALTAVRQRDRAEEQLRVATSRFLSAEATAAVSRQHSQSLLLAIEALESSPTAEARAALYGALARLPQALRYLQPRTGGPQRIALSPSGRTLVAGTAGGALEFFDARSGRRRRTITLGDGTVTDLAFAPNGGALAAIDGAGAVRLVDPRTGRTRGRLPELRQGERTNAVAFGPRGLLATGSSAGELWLWEGETRGPLAGPFGRHLGGVTDVALSPDGDLLAASGDDMRVSVWRLGAAPRLETELVPGEGRAAAVAFSPDGRRLAASAQNGEVAVWATEDWRPIGGQRRHPGGEVTAVTFSGDGTLLASGGFDDVVRLWDPVSGEPQGRPLPGHIAFVSDLAAASSARVLASAGADGNIVLWDPARDDRLGRPLAGAGDRPVGTLAAQSGGRRLAWVDGGGSLMLSDGRATRELLAVGADQEVRAVAFSPDGRRLAASAGEELSPSPDTVYIWDVRTRSPVGRPLRAKPYTRSLAFTPDGRRLFAAGFGSVLRWELPSGRRTGRVMSGESIAVSPDGRLLAATRSVTQQGTVALRDAGSGRLVGQLRTGRASLVWDVAFSPDGRAVAAGDNDGNIVLWDVATRHRVGEPLTGHRSRVEFVDLSPAGDLLASSDSSGAMLLWDLRTRRALGAAVPGTRPSFGADGDLLASAAPRGGITLRPLDPERWRSAACALANRNLGPREWTQFMGDEPYEPTCPGLERGHPATVAVSAH